MTEPVATQPAETCIRCRHLIVADNNGVLRHVDKEHADCLCQHVFSVPEGGEPELRSNPRVNNLLVSLRRIRDKASTLDEAKEIALLAIQNFIEATRSNK